MALPYPLTMENGKLKVHYTLFCMNAKQIRYLIDYIVMIKPGGPNAREKHAEC